MASSRNGDSSRPSAAGDRTGASGAERDRSSLPTIVAVAVCAYAACDMIHEVVGHGTACLLSPSVHAVSLTTVALQTMGQSRWVAFAGVAANLIAGILALIAARRMRFGATRYFFLLLGAVNLMNAAGYLLFSALLGVGDLAVVIAGWTPPLAWRAGMGVVGIAFYGLVVFIVAGEFARLVSDGLAPSEVPRLIVPAYFAGALLLVAGAAMNPIDPGLILMSGASTGFGAMAGLLFVPPRVEGLVRGAGADGRGLPASRAWIVAGVVCAVVFVVVIGRGITL